MPQAARPDLAYLRNFRDSLRTASSQKDCVLIVGFGSLGSSVGLGLHRAGIPFLSIDHDVWNTRNQFNSCWDQVEPQTKKAVRFDGSQTTPGIWSQVEDIREEISCHICLLATDSAESRRAALEPGRIDPTYGFIDIRTGRHSTDLVCGGRRFVRDHLPQGETEQLNCDERGTIYHSMVAAGLALSRIFLALDNQAPIPNQAHQVGYGDPSGTPYMLEIPLLQTAPT